MCKADPQHTYLKSNLLPLEHKALEQLTHNESIVIKPTDKGRSIVIQDRADYILESRRILSDTKTYQTLPSDPTLQFALESTILVNKALEDKIISKTEASFLKKKFYKVPFTTCQKITKTLPIPRAVQY